MSIPSAITLNLPLEHGLVYYINQDRIHSFIKIADLFKEGRIAVFGGPAPFSRLDTEHATMYEKASAELKSLGIDKIVAIYVQDAFVCKKFSEEVASNAGSNNVEYYADGDAFFTQAYGLGHNFTNQGLSMRCDRWCAITNNGTVEYVQHDNYDVIEDTSPNLMLDHLRET